MEEGDENVVQQFYKRRRDLVLLSAFVFVVALLDIEFKKFNFLGNELNIKQPEAVPLLLAITLTYFFMRYFHYLREHPDTLFVTRLNSKVHEYFFDRIDDEFVIRYLSEEQRQSIKGEVRQSWNCKIERWKISVNCIYKNPKNEAWLGGSVQSFDLPKIEAFWIYFRIAPYFIIASRYFIDYAFPAIFAVSSLLFLIAKYQTIV
jgi:hypothetical protein